MEYRGSRVESNVKTKLLWFLSLGMEESIELALPSIENEDNISTKKEEKSRE